MNPAVPVVAPNCGAKFENDALAHPSCSPWARWKISPGFSLRYAMRIRCKAGLNPVASTFVIYTESHLLL